MPIVPKVLLNVGLLLKQGFADITKQASISSLYVHFVLPLVGPEPDNVP